jgi:hypothetical protein
LKLFLAHKLEKLAILILIVRGLIRILIIKLLVLKTIIKDQSIDKTFEVFSIFISKISKQILIKNQIEQKYLVNRDKEILF